MSVAAQRELPDTLPISAATTPVQSQASKDAEDCEMKSDYLSRRLARVMTTCPGCQKSLQVGTLAWTHKCKGSKQQPSEKVVHERSAKMVANATKRHGERMAKNSKERSRSRSRSRSAGTCFSASSCSATNSPGACGADSTSSVVPN